MDIYPSISDYLGVPVEDKSFEFLMGKSFLDILREEQDQNHQYLFAETNYSDMKPTFQAVISIDYKFIKVLPAKPRPSTLKTTISRLIKEGIWLSILRNPFYMFKRYGRLEPRQLFNLTTDPNEIQNLVDQNTDIVEKMEKILSKWQDDCIKLALPRSPDGSNIDEEEMLRQHLRALGYMD
jgi:hypothetical protein